MHTIKRIQNLINVLGKQLRYKKSNLWFFSICFCKIIKAEYDLFCNESQYIMI